MTDSADTDNTTTETDAPLPPHMYDVYRCPECHTTLDASAIRSSCRDSIKREKARLSMRLTLISIVTAVGAIIAVETIAPTHPVAQFTVGIVLVGILLLFLCAMGGMFVEALYDSDRTIPIIKPRRYL